MKLEATAEDVEHFAPVTKVLQERWGAMPQEYKEKMQKMKEDADPEAHKVRVAEFMDNWNGCSQTEGRTGRLNKAEFQQFTKNQLENSEKNLGWAPEYSEDVANQIWDAIHALNTAEPDVGLVEYTRFGACMQKMMNENGM